MIVWELVHCYFYYNDIATKCHIYLYSQHQLVGVRQKDCDFEASLGYVVIGEPDYI